MSGGLELTILMPCLNEAETLARCIVKSTSFLRDSDIAGEVLIADNGSTDGSRDIAVANGARVVEISERGYGSALIGGIRAARGKYAIMGDSDDSYDFGALGAFVERLRAGDELVMGNRFLGGIEPGAMPFLHRYLGNPVLSGIGRLFFGSPIGDFHCGLRGFRRDAVMALDLRAPGMEFASEMVVKATINKLRISEVPTVLHRDGRSRPPHLRSWRDGWRHLRFLLLFAPRWLFVYPGLAMLLAGSIGMAWLFPQSRTIGGITFDLNSLYYAALASVIGFQAVLFGILAKLYGVRAGLTPPDERFQKMVSIVTFEVGLIVGAILVLAGSALGAYAVASWGAVQFGPLPVGRAMRYVIGSGTAIILGFQIAYGAFFMSVLELRSTRSRTHQLGDPPIE